jgi:hypothetical protein
MLFSSFPNNKKTFILSHRIKVTVTQIVSNVILSSIIGFGFRTYEIHYESFVRDI